MPNISFLAFTKVELKDLIVCIVVNGEKIQSPTKTLTLIRQYPLSNLSEIFSYTTMYLNFMFLDRLLFELLCKTHTHTDAHTHTHTHAHAHTHTNTHTHRDSDEYSIVAFCKNTTIIIIQDNVAYFIYLIQNCMLELSLSDLKESQYGMI